VAEFCEKHNLGEVPCSNLAASMHAKKQWVIDGRNKPFEASVHIVVQWYGDKNPARAKEIDACLRFNLENPHVLKV